MKLLLLLTAADIRAVGPGVWNGWKGQLLRSLYYDTEPLLAGGHTREPRKSRINSAQARLRETLDGWPPAEIERFIQRHEPDYWLKTDLERQVQHAKIIRSFESERPVVAFDAKCDEFRSLTELTLVTGVKGDAVQPLTELTLVTQDTPRLLMIFAGACAAAGANIASAQISTTREVWPWIRSSCSGFFPTAKRSNGRRKSRTRSARYFPESEPSTRLKSPAVCKNRGSAPLA